MAFRFPLGALFADEPHGERTGRARKRTHLPLPIFSITLGHAALPMQAGAPSRLSVTDESRDPSGDARKMRPRSREYNAPVTHTELLAKLMQFADEGHIAEASSSWQVADLPTSRRSCLWISPVQKGALCRIARRIFAYFRKKHERGFASSAPGNDWPMRLRV